MKNKNHRALFDAVSGIDDDLIAEAAAPKVLPFPKRILRVAAIAAVIAILMTALLWPSEENYITGPGVLVVRAYEMDEPMLSKENSTILEEGITFPTSFTWRPNISSASASGLHFHFSVPENEYEGMTITFEVKLSGGDFRQYAPHNPDPYENLKATYLGQHFTIGNNSLIVWDRTAHIFNDKEQEVQYVELATNQVFVDIIVRADNRIIAYAVIEIIEAEEDVQSSTFTYHSRMLNSVSFPLVHGFFQSVSEKYVQEQINKIHAEREALS